MVLSWTLLWNQWVGNARRSHACWLRWPEWCKAHKREQLIKRWKDGGWEKYTPSFSSDGDDDEEQSSDEWSETSAAVAPFDPRTMHKVSLSSSCSSSVKKTTAVLKWPWRRKIKGGKVESGTAHRKPGGINPQEAAEGKAQQTPGNMRNLKERRQRSLRTTECLTHRWMKRKLRGQRAPEKAQKEKPTLYDLLETAATNEKREERDRDKLRDKLEAFLTRKEEEDETTGLMEEMRKTGVAAQQKSFEAERSLCNALREYVDGCRDPGRARTLMTKCLAINAEPRHKEYELRKRLGTHTAHSQEGELVRRRENDKVVEAVGGWRTMNPAAKNLSPRWKA